MRKKCNNKKIKELLTLYHLGILTPEEKEEVEIHLIECELCRKELNSAEEFSSFMKKNREVILANLRRREVRRKRVGVLQFLVAKKLLVTASLLLFSIIGISIYYFLFFEKPEIEGPVVSQEVRGKYIEIFRPYGSVPNKPQIIKWSGVEDAHYYLVQLQDNTDEILWSALSHGNEIKIPSFIQEKINRGKNYFIKIKALSQDGRIILKSKKVEFSISQ